MHHGYKHQDQGSKIIDLCIIYINIYDPYKCIRDTYYMRACILDTCINDTHIMDACIMRICFMDSCIMDTCFIKDQGS